MSSCILQIVELLRAGQEGLVAPCVWLLAAIGAVVAFGWASRLLLRGFGGAGLRRTALVVLAIGAVLWGGGKGVRRTGTPATAPAAAEPARTPGTATNAVPTAAFRIADIVLSDGAFAVETAWTNGLLEAGTLVDYLVKTNLLDALWTWDGAEAVATGATGQVHAVNVDRYAAASNGLDGIIYRLPPRQLFVHAVPRLPRPDLRDSDGDGLPDNYEILGSLGTNPWVPDDALAAKTRLGSVTNLQDELDRSAPYGVFELALGEYDLPSPVHLPAHPVMLCAPAPYAVVRSAASPAPFVLDGAQSGQTLFRNLYVWLDARSGYQAAFWCGGNLPWSGEPASASFRDVYVRMPRPGVEYFGWHFYRWREAAAEISGCTLNAAGATWANGIYGYDPPPIAVRNCSFLNFPANRLSARACGVYLETSAANYGGVEGTVPVSISDTLFDASFTNATPLARLEHGTNFAVSARNCIVPAGFVEGHAPDVCEGLWTTNAGVAWCGVPFPGSAADALGAGAHVVLMPGDTDSDGDGDSDHAEAYVLGTDPWLADSDGDGAPDALEREQGTDPRDGQSFLRSIAVSVTNAQAAAGVSVRVGWGRSPDISTDWNGTVESSARAFAADFERISVSGPVYVKAFRDFDGDGVPSPSREPVLVREVGTDRAAHRVSLVFGDVDGDGVSDAGEHAQGTSPNDARSFRLSFTLAVTNVDETASVTNVLLVGASPWDANPRRFTGRQLSAAVSETVSDGGVSAVCWRDLDRDGACTPGVDTVYSNFFGHAANGTTRTLTIGDRDGDGVGDGVERAEGTDVFGKGSYCVDLAATYTDVFRTTNALTFCARFGEDVVWGPASVTGRTWTCAFGHRVATAGERPRVDVWDDVDGNGRWDAGECGNRCDIAVKAHAMSVTNKLSYGNFDRDKDNLPDWWEAREGLPADGSAADEYADPDGDGLVNLHEFWAGTHPLVPDGSNTLLSVCARSVDDRLAGIEPLGDTWRFADYFHNASNEVFVANTNLWCRDVDLSCVSMWHQEEEDNETRGTRTAIAITRRHVLLSNHWHSNQYRFCDAGGNVFTGMIDRAVQIHEDTFLGRLANSLPSSVTPAKLLPSDYEDYIGEGKYLPSLCVNEKQQVVVGELGGLNTEVGTYRVYGKEAATNVVTESRERIRGVISIGQSSSPVFLLVGNVPVLLFVKHWGYPNALQWNPTWGPSLPYFIDKIQRTIDAWEGIGNYKLDMLDLSVFGRLNGEGVGQ